MDLGAFADEWARQHQREQVQALVKTPAPEVQQAPPMRQVPDGSWIGADFNLSWDGYQGDPSSRVVLHHASGQVLFDGTYADLTNVSIPGVWAPAQQIQLPVQSAAEQQPMQVSGMAGLGEELEPRGRGGLVRFAGTALAALAAGGAAYATARWMKKRRGS